MNSYQLILLAAGCGLCVATASAIDRPASPDQGVQVAPDSSPAPTRILPRQDTPPTQQMASPKKTGQVRLGIIPGEVPQLVRAQLAMSGYPGIVVESMEPNGPAQKAGLRDLDIILRIGDIPISGIASLKEAVNGKNPGDQVKVQYLRGGKEQDCTLTLEESLYGDVPQGATAASEGLMQKKIDQAIGAGRRTLPRGSAAIDDISKAFDIMDGLMNGIADDPFERIDHIRSLMNQRMGMPQPQAIPTPQGSTSRSDVFSTSTASFSDAQGTIRIATNSKDGTKIYVTDPNGKVQFEGPYNTPEEKASVPPEIQKRLSNLNIELNVR